MPDLIKKRNPECLNPREVRIVNIKSGEILRLNATFDDLTTIVVELLRGKYEPVALKTDENFFSECERVVESACFAPADEEDEEKSVCSDV
jgi:hypothetical protein